MEQNKPNNAPPSGDFYLDDEVNLMDIVDILVRRKWLIFVITTLVTAVAVLYCVVTPRVYLASISFGPPRVSDVAPLQVNLPFYSGDSVDLGDRIYKSFLRALQDTAVRKVVWQGLEKEKGGGRLSFAEFDRAVSYTPENPQKKKMWGEVVFENGDSEYAAETLNFLFKKVNAKVVARFVGESIDILIYEKKKIAIAKQRRKQDILLQIRIIRQRGEKERLARVARLEEELRIAEKIGSVALGTTPKGGGGLAVSSVIVTDEFPRYLLGAKVLRAELAEIRQRKSNDPYLDELSKLQVELDSMEFVHGATAGGGGGQEINYFRLQEMMIDAEMSRLKDIRDDFDIIRAASADLPASVPSVPIKPRMKRIVFLAFVVGVMLSFFSLFVVNVVETYRQRGKLS